MSLVAVYGTAYDLYLQSDVGDSSATAKCYGNFKESELLKNNMYEMSTIFFNQETTYFGYSNQLYINVEISIFFSVWVRI